MRGRRRRVRKTRDRREELSCTRGSDSQRRESCDPQRDRRDRRNPIAGGPRGTIVGERLPWDALLTALRDPITSICFPEREHGASRELTTPVRAREATLTCSRVFSRGRHAFLHVSRPRTLVPNAM